MPPKAKLAKINRKVKNKSSAQVQCGIQLMEVDPKDWSKTSIDLTTLPSGGIQGVEIQGGSASCVVKKFTRAALIKLLDPEKQRRLLELDKKKKQLMRDFASFGQLIINEYLSAISPKVAEILAKMKPKATRTIMECIKKSLEKSEKRTNIPIDEVYLKVGVGYKNSVTPTYISKAGVDMVVDSNSTWLGVGNTGGVTPTYISTADVETEFDSKLIDALNRMERNDNASEISKFVNCDDHLGIQLMEVDPKDWSKTSIDLTTLPSDDIHGIVIQGGSALSYLTEYV